LFAIKHVFASIVCRSNIFIVRGHRVDNHRCYVT